MTKFSKPENWREAVRTASAPIVLMLTMLASTLVARSDMLVEALALAMSKLISLVPAGISETVMPAGRFGMLNVFCTLMSAEIGVMEGFLMTNGSMLMALEWKSPFFTTA